MAYQTKPLSETPAVNFVMFGIESRLCFPNSDSSKPVNRPMQGRDPNATAPSKPHIGLSTAVWDICRVSRYREYQSS